MWCPVNMHSCMWFCAHNSMADIVRHIILHILKSYVFCRTLTLYFDRENEKGSLLCLYGVYFLAAIVFALPVDAWSIFLFVLMYAGPGDNSQKETTAGEMMDDENEQEMLRCQIRVCQKQLKAMEEQKVTGSILRHDMKHHARLLADYIYEGKNEKALAYIRKMKLYAGGSRKQVATGNEDVDSILNYYMEEIGRIGGSAAVDIKLIQELLMDGFDINVLLGNLLLNACEAMKKSEKKELSVAMGYAKGMLALHIKNTYNGKLRQEKDRIMTTKEGAGHHGRGLASIRRIIEKYDGNMEIFCTSEEFTVKAFLFVPSAGYPKEIR